MSGTVGRILFNDATENRQDVVSCLVYLSIPFCRLQAIATCAVYDANIPILSAIKALYFKRDLAQLDALRVTHAADQLLRLFAELNGSNPPLTSHGSGVYQIGRSVS